jgi:hypothetical protein
MIRSRVGDGAAHFIFCTGKTWLHYAKPGKDDGEDADPLKWTILAKQGGGDDRIRHGDYLQIVKKTDPSVTIKSYAKSGFTWATGAGHIKHYLVIERIEDDAVALEPAQDLAAADAG